MPKFAGADWLKTDARRVVSDFGTKVADILGQAYCGIYHLDPGQIRAAEWGSKYRVEIRVSRHLSTFDTNELTRMLVLCHDAKIRLEIAPCNMQLLRLIFWCREANEQHIYDRHPSMEQAIEAVRS